MASLLRNLLVFPILSYLKKKSLEKIHIPYPIWITTFTKQSQLDRYRATHVCKTRKLSDKPISKKVSSSPDFLPATDRLTAANWILAKGVTASSLIGFGLGVMMTSS